MNTRNELSELKCTPPDIMTDVCTCPCAVEVFPVVVFSYGQNKCMWPGESKVPLCLSPGAKVLFISKELSIQKAHQVFWEVPHLPTQFLNWGVLIDSYGLIQHCSVQSNDSRNVKDVKHTAISETVDCEPLSYKKGCSLFDYLFESDIHHEGWGIKPTSRWTRPLGMSEVAYFQNSW